MRKVYEAAMANVLHVVMASNEPLDEWSLFPPGIGEETVTELFSILCEVDWANPRRLVHLREIEA